MLVARCADCGEEIVYLWTVQAWAAKETSDRTNLACRIFYDTENRCTGVDYHHAIGHAQKRYRFRNQD